MTFVLLDGDNPACVVRRVPEGQANLERSLRDLVFAHPEILPVAEIEPGIGRVAAVATELNLPGAGFADVLLVSEHGRLIIVECKLWRNPQARREVVVQILDYARKLADSDYESLQGAVSDRLDRKGNILFELARAAGSTMTEAAFVDRVSRDLRDGRFLLLLVGDGITEGVQRLTEYLNVPGLAFEFGLVEIADYRFDDPLTGLARRIIQPRVIARTAIVGRHVIRSEVPGLVIDVVEDESGPTPRRGSAADTGASPEAHARWRTFAQDFIAGVRFDDPGQLAPRIGGLNWMRVPMPGPAHLSLYRTTNGAIGAFLRYRDAADFSIYAALEADRDAIAREFLDDGLPEPIWSTDDDGARITIRHPSPLPWDEAQEEAQRDWLGRAANRFVNSFRPRLLRLEA